MLSLVVCAGAYLQEEWELCANGPCECEPDILRVRCRSVGIQAVLTQYFPADTEILVLRDNGMTRIPDNFFIQRSFKNLIELRLRNDSLTELTSDGFLGIPQLRRLYILYILYNEMTQTPFSMA